MNSKAGLIAAIVAAFALTGCREDRQNADGSLSSETGGRQLSVIGSLRPKADPDVVEKIHEEDAAKQRQQLEAMQAQQKALQDQNRSMDPANRDLPAVDTNPISGIASALGFNTNSQSQTPPMNPSAGQMSGIPTMGGSVVAPPPPQAAMYGGGYPSMGGAGMIPPPPAVSLTTQAAPYQPPVDPNFQAYMQAGAYGAPGYYPPPQYAQAAMPAHPAGSMFSSGASGALSSSSNEEKKRPAMVVITPTGMEPRSPYKQRDDLKVLVKGAFSSAPNQELREPKTAAVLARADVGLPSESTKGNLSLTPRQMNSLFKNPVLDKRIAPNVVRIEQEVAQSYYRYLYAYNKYALTQQQIAARKQEMEVADSASEKQRAAADLASAQNEADASKEDLRAAQQDLASIAGVQAARSVITKVSGVAPSMESLAVAEAEPQQVQQGGLLGSMQNAFGALNFFGKGKKDGDGGEKVAAAPAEKEKPAKEKKDKKDKKKGKDGDGGGAQVASLPAAQESAPVERSSPAPSTGISFELKNVQTTPRKSVLKVAVRNNGGESFNLDPDVISVSEGDKRLAEASVLAQFDSTLVAPNAEVTGTITIFGRPWNDKLTVSLSDGGKTIQLRR